MAVFVSRISTGSDPVTRRAFRLSPMPGGGYALRVTDDAGVLWAELYFPGLEFKAAYLRAIEITKGV